VGTLSASSPALDERRAYVTLLEDMQGRERGRVVAVRKRDGRTAWARNLSSRTESSPLVHGGRMYFGTEDGTLYALSTRTGRTVWTFRARGSIKGSPTLANGRLYFGDYGGYVHAVRARNGRAAWSQPVAARAFRGGRFYATAAVNWGRVFIGSTDGRQYALSARTGALAWARQTGNYVYSSAALANVPRRGPTVFFGSYDGNLYALDARSGRTRWTFRSGDRISGSPTVIGDVVYFSDLGRRRTFGIDTRSGERVFRRPFGAYDAVISDGRHLIVTGHRRVVAYRAANAPPPHKVRQPQGTGLPAAQWANRQRARQGRRAGRRQGSDQRRRPGRARRAAQQRRAQLRRCAKRDTRRARSRCRARIRGR
jgi:outer membrane protein assembly factor BamB